MKGFVELVFAVCFCIISIFGVTRGQADADDMWSAQLAELKLMMSTMNSKMTALDNKMAELNFLEYAFKVNSVDNHLTTIKQSLSNLEARMTLVESQAEDIKELVSKKENFGQPCREIPDDRRIASTQNSPRVGGGVNACCGDLTKKIEDYGYKISKSQQELKEDSNKQQQTLNNLLDTVRNGFTKSFQRVDLLPNIERQLLNFSRLSRTIERLTNVTNRLSNAQIEIGKLSQGSSAGSQESSSRMAASLSHAMGLGEKVKTGLRMFPKVESDIAGARKMAKNLLSGRDTRRPITAETLKTLTTTIENIEKTVSPLFFSVSNGFEGMYELLNITLNSFDRRETQFCNFHDVFKFEMNEIIERFENNKDKCFEESEMSDKIQDSDHHEIKVSTKKQQEIIDNLNYMRAATMMVKTDLENVFLNCPDGSISTAKPIGMVLG